MSAVILIGYSGHAFVVCDIFRSQQLDILGYCERSNKENNPFRLTFLGTELDKDSLKLLAQSNYFTAIGDNLIRRAINSKLKKKLDKPPINAIHKNA